MKKILSTSYLSDILVGLMIGAMIVLSALLDASFLFSGPYRIYLLSGMGILLIAGIILSVLNSLFSAYRFVIASVQETSTAIILVSIGPIISAVMTIAPNTDPFPTVFAGIVCSGLITGIMLCLLGYLRVGDFISFVPFPVMAGFLAGTGWLLLWGSVPLMIGHEISAVDLQLLLTLPSVLMWLPGLLFGILLLLLPTDKPMWIYWMCMGALMLFYFGFHILGIPLQNAGKMGLLLGPFHEGNFFGWLHSGKQLQVHWSALYQQITNLLVLIVLTPIAMLLNISSLEIETGKEFELNRELVATGKSNIISSLLGGGVVGYPSITFSLMSYKFGAKSILTSLTITGVCLITLFFGASIIGLLPRFVFAGLLIYIGLSILKNWLIKTFVVFSIWDYLVIWLILFVIVTLGFIQGIGVGIVAAVVIFVVKYSQIRVIKFSMNGKVRHSNVERDDLIRKVLDKYTDKIVIYELQGYLFFGNGNFILKQISNAISDSNLRDSKKYIILDFKDVQGIDSSSVRSFIKLYNRISENQDILILTNMDHRLIEIFKKQSDFFNDKKDCYYFHDLDHGIEFCENDILEQLNNIHAFEVSLEGQFENYSLDHTAIIDLFKWLKKVEVPEGFILFKQGEPSDSMYFLQSGAVEVSIADPKGKMIRLRTMGAGTFVGETGLYLGSLRGANVVAKENCRLYRLDLDDFKKIQKEHPKVAAVLNSYVACHLMTRMAYANELVRALLRSQSDL